MRFFPRYFKISVSHCLSLSLFLSFFVPLSLLLSPPLFHLVSYLSVVALALQIILIKRCFSAFSISVCGVLIEHPLAISCTLVPHAIHRLFYCLITHPHGHSPHSVCVCRFVIVMRVVSPLSCPVILHHTAASELVTCATSCCTLCVWLKLNEEEPHSMLPMPVTSLHPLSLSPPPFPLPFHMFLFGAGKQDTFSFGSVWFGLVLVAALPFLLLLLFHLVYFFCLACALFLLRFTFYTNFRSLPFRLYQLLFIATLLIEFRLRLSL